MTTSNINWNRENGRSESSDGRFVIIKMAFDGWETYDKNTDESECEDTLTAAKQRCEHKVAIELRTSGSAQ